MTQLETKAFSATTQTAADVALPLNHDEFSNILNRPGSPVAMYHYGPSETPLVQVLVEQDASRVGARTLGHVVDKLPDGSPIPYALQDGAVPVFVREMKSSEVIVWWEMKYLYEAESIHFWLTGLEGPTTTPITVMELNAILRDPSLLSKTTFHTVNHPAFDLWRGNARYPLR
jgi:hypothetical protein